jgi:hypothetical protein
MEIMCAIKFAEFYALQSAVIALVGVTLIAGLYQLIREWVRALKETHVAATNPLP